MKLKNRTRLLLFERNDNMAQLAARVELSYPTVHRFVTSEYIPEKTPINTMYTIAKALGCSVGDLYSDESGSDA